VSSPAPRILTAVALPATPPAHRLWLAARYRCTDDAALAADRIRREVNVDGSWDATAVEPRLSGSTMVVDFELPQRDTLLRLVRRTHGRVIAI